MKGFTGGLLGGFSVVALFLIIIFSTNIFNYRIMIINPDNSYKNSTSIMSSKSQIIKELKQDGIIISPQDYTNNIISYYNTALTILITMLVLFSLVSYIHLRFISREQINSVFKEIMKDSKEFEQCITETIFGKAEDNFASVEILNELSDRVERIETELDLKDSKDNEYLVMEENKL